MFFRYNSGIGLRTVRTFAHFFDGREMKKETIVLVMTGLLVASPLANAGFQIIGEYEEQKQENVHLQSELDQLSRSHQSQAVQHQSGEGTAGDDQREREVGLNPPEYPKDRVVRMRIN